MRLILWDIDGTLVRAGPIASEAFSRAVERAVGTSPGAHGVRMSGKTDPQIALEILAVMGVAEADAREHLPAVLEHLETELAGAAALMRHAGHVLPGVVELLRRLGEERGVTQTVLTGNTVANATVKLAAFGLERWLDVELGAFGSDHHDRRELVPVALERVRRLRGVSYRPEQVWIVGDTPRDLACARAAGVRCLLVATGRVPLRELAAAGADAALADLADVERVASLLLSGTPARA